jgi:hypothetical protein
MVGEVRQSLAAARPVEGRLDAPSVASAGDELSIALALRNCTDTSRSVEIVGKNQKIELPAKARRQITLRHRLGNGNGPVVEAGGILGQQSALTGGINQAFGAVQGAGGFGNLFGGGFRGTPINPASGEFMGSLEF